MNANLCILKVLALALNSGLVTFPVGYDTVWSAPGIHLWRPKCPEGYIALGCLATTGIDPPSLTTMVCLHHTLGVEAPLGQCLAVKQQEGSPDEGDRGQLSEEPGVSVWCVDNASATFTVCTAGQGLTPQGQPPCSLHKFASMLCTLVFLFPSQRRSLRNSCPCCAHWSAGFHYKPLL